MAFYSAIYKQYDNIFMLNNSQVGFIKDEFPEGKRLLDVGCATGKLANKLAMESYQIDAIDLDPHMISYAKKNHQHEDVHFSVQNMLHISNIYKQNLLDGILCFGNTIVHLTNIDEIKEFFTAAYRSIKIGGKFLFQILNYDYVLKKNITKLPLIDNEHVSFVRTYQYPNNGLINFHTDLLVKSTTEKIHSEIELYPLTQLEIINALTEIGFTNISFYSNFDKTPLNNNVLPLIVSAQK